MTHTPQCVTVPLVTTNLKNPLEYLTEDGEPTLLAAIEAQKIIDAFLGVSAAFAVLSLENQSSMPGDDKMRRMANDVETSRTALNQRIAQALLDADDLNIAVNKFWRDEPDAVFCSCGLVISAARSSPLSRGRS